MLAQRNSGKLLRKDNGITSADRPERNIFDTNVGRKGAWW